MCARLRFPLLVVALLAVPLAASAQGTPRGKGGGRTAHPKVNAAEACDECHSQATPAAFREWQQGTHGINLVKCFVCHGSTGADFRRKPVADRCVGCHADQVASMSGAAMKGKDCFSCHSAHALNPHAMGPATTTAALLGADKLAPMVTVEGKMPPPAPPAAAAPAAQPGSAAPATQPGAAPAAAGSASTQPGAPPPAAPGIEKDVKQSQPHPPTDR